MVYEDLPFDQQLRLTASAETIIGVHGAALGHLIASPPGGRLVEIVNPAQPHPEYWSLAALAGWNYHPVLAEALTKTRDPADCDVRVPPDQLVALEAAVDNPRSSDLTAAVAENQHCPHHRVAAPACRLLHSHDDQVRLQRGGPVSSSGSALAADPDLGWLTRA